jgi:hypothetical protein
LVLFLVFCIDLVCFGFYIGGGFVDFLLIMLVVY